MGQVADDRADGKPDLGPADWMAEPENRAYEPFLRDRCVLTCRRVAACDVSGDRLV